jgi:hypothetical protein
MSTTKVVLASLSAAMDGGFTATADVSEARSVAGAEGDYRLIGGVTVMLHIQRLALVRAVRTEWRDAEDLWRCLEIAAAEGGERSDFDDSATLRDIRPVLWRELGPGGAAVTALTERLRDDAATRLLTRLRALLAEVVGNH